MSFDLLRSDAGKLVTAKFKLMPVVFMLAVMLSGCASNLENHQKYIVEAASDPGTFGTLLSAVGNPEVSGFISTAYIGGTRAEKFELDDLNKFKEGNVGDVKVEIMLPPRYVSSFSDVVDDENNVAFQKNLDLAASVINDLRYQISTLSGLGLHISILAAPVRQGVIVTVEDSLGDDRLKIVVANAFDDGTQVEGWVLSALTAIAHELLHVHYRLDGSRKFDFQTRKAANEEASAFLFGWCSAIGAQREFGSNSMDMSFNIRSVERFFPGIDAGRYCPNWDAIQTLQDRADRGRVLALTAAALANPALKFDTEDDATTKGIFRLCSSLPERVPDFLSGDVPGIQEESACSE